MTEVPRAPRSALAPTAAYDYSVATSFTDVAALRPEWERLFLQSGTSNVFAHPSWLLSWAELYIDDGDLCVLCIRADGELVAVAPFHRIRRPGGAASRSPLVRVLRPLGVGHATEITELPEIITLDKARKKLLPVVIRGLIDHVVDWDWLELTLTPEQGWLDPEWIAPLGQRLDVAAFHKRTRACVVAPLPESWEAFRSELGRNVRESIRRGENRLRRAGHEWCLVDDFSSAPQIAGAVERIASLHSARAQLDRGPHHPNYLDDDHAREFLQRATSRLVATGNATPALLEVDGQAVAARLLLHANSSTFFSLSGFDPGWWDFGVATTLVTEALRRCIARGETSANLSTGPERSKLRWSQELRLHQDFVLVRKKRRSSLAFGVFWTARAATHLHRHRRLNEPSE